MSEPSDKNKLENTWCFWEHRKGGGANDYGTKMFQLGEFNTVEGFWRFKNNMPLPSEVFFTVSGGTKKFDDREIDGFSMFKHGIRPEWEDKANMHGGEYFCRQMFTPPVLDDIWEKLVLGLIGEVIDPDSEICGVRCVDKSRSGRATYRLEMWFKGRDPEVLDLLRNNLANCLGGTNYLKEYMEHNVAMSHHGTGRKGSSRSLK